MTEKRFKVFIQCFANIKHFAVSENILPFLNHWSVKKRMRFFFQKTKQKNSAGSLILVINIIKQVREAQTLRAC